jgi:hypothetical protein
MQLPQFGGKTPRPFGSDPNKDSRLAIKERRVFLFCATEK